MFGKAKIQYSSVWKRKSPEFQCLEFPKFLILLFGKAKTHYSNVWKKPKIKNFNAWNSQEFCV